MLKFIFICITSGLGFYVGGITDHEMIGLLIGLVLGLIALIMPSTGRGSSGGGGIDFSDFDFGSDD